MATGTIKVLDVVEAGINNNCRYEKFSDGTYHAWLLGSFSFEAGTAWMNGYFHRSSPGISAPSFSKSVTRVTGGISGTNLAIYCGSDSSNSSNIRLYFYDAVSAAESSRPAVVDIYGTW